jgi:Mn-dependent DtxR family transcriptional regulator
VLVPMRTTEKLGKLGLIELRASRLTLTERGRQILGRM